MAAIPVNILIDKADFAVTFFITNKDGTPLNMSGYTGAAAMKKSYSATTSVPFTLDFVNRTTGEIALLLTDTEHWHWIVEDMSTILFLQILMDMN